jgi:hypothetical protein
MRRRGGRREERGGRRGGEEERREGAGSREQGAGSREQGGGRREQGAWSREEGGGRRKEGGGRREIRRQRTMRTMSGIGGELVTTSTPVLGSGDTLTENAPYQRLGPARNERREKEV